MIIGIHNVVYYGKLKSIREYRMLIKKRMKKRIKKRMKKRSERAKSQCVKSKNSNQVTSKW